MINQPGFDMTQIEPVISLQTERMLRLPDVKARVRLGKSAIYEMMARGEFPHNLKLGRRAVAWRSSSIDAWIAQKIGAAA